jgi:DNA-sulfur modification-associated
VTRSKNPPKGPVTNDDDFALDEGAERNDWTNEFLCIYGSYRWLNAGPIHYLSTTLSLNDLRSQTISLMEEIEGVERWGFDAIFQRNIDRERVSRIVKTYLNRDDRFKFFPAITVVLLPAQENRILPAYPERLVRRTQDAIRYWRMPGLELQFRAHAGAEPRSNQMAKLKWDRTKFLAAVVDGQHRVAALREYMEARADQKTAEKDIPAIVVLFDPDLFSDDAAQKRSLTQLTRELFIDVNQNAAKVADSRLIVLDDRDVARAATRSLIFESKEDTEGTWAVPKWTKVAPNIDLVVLPGIPQEIVDAFADRKNSDNLKLKPWQYTSAFTLQRAIRHFVFEDSWKRFERVLDLGSLETEGGVVWDAICDRRQQLTGDDEEDDDEAAYAGEEEFSFSPAITRRLVDRFSSSVGVFLRAVLTGFTPYQRVLQACTKAFATREGPDIRSYLLNEAPLSDDSGKRRSQFARHLEEQFPDRLETIEAAIKTFEKPTGWRDNLVWWSVLQRALLWQPKEIQRAIEGATDAPQPTWAQTAGRYVLGLNSLFEKGIFVRKYEVVGKLLWGGIVVRLANEAPLDYTDSAAKRAAALLRILVAAEIAKGRKIAYDEFRQLCDRNKGLSPAWKRCMSSYAKAFSRRDKLERRSEREDDVYKEEAEQHLSSCIQKIVFQPATKSK